MIKNKKLLFVLIAACFLIIIGTQTTIATETCRKPKQIVAKLQVEWPASPLTSYKLSPDTSLAEMVNYFFEWGVGLGGLGVFIALIIAGIQYITSIASPTKLNDAKSRITSSLIGLVLLLSSWAIFQLINPGLKTMEKKLPDMAKNGGTITETYCNNGPIDCCLKNEDSCDPNSCAPVDPACDPTTTTCELRDCCPKVNDPTCVAKNWLCCQKNDANCIKGKAARPLPNSIATNPNPCIYDSDCSSWYCKCDESTWTKHCAPTAENQKICIMTIDQPELGCNIIRFYKNGFPDPTASAPLAAGDYYDYTIPDRTWSGGDSGWVPITFGTAAPKAYEAISWAKDNAGNFLYSDGSGGISSTDTGHGHALIHCGATACGCTINGCFSPNPTDSSCGSPDGTTGDEWAYNELVSNSITVFRMVDPTKSTSSKVSSKLTSGATTIWNGATSGASTLLNNVATFADYLGSLWPW